MNAINPKADFQEFGGPYVEEARKQLPQVWFRQAVNISLAEMGFIGAAEAEMAGARKFAAILINIAEKPAKLEPMPVKRLSES